MKFTNKKYSLPTELELSRYFYDYDQHKASGDTREGDILSTFEGITSAPNGAPTNYSGPISIFNPFDEDLCIYSLGGLEVLDITDSFQDRQEQRESVRKYKKLLYSSCNNH